MYRSRREYYIIVTHLLQISIRVEKQYVKRFVCAVSIAKEATDIFRKKGEGIKRLINESTRIFARKVATIYRHC